VLVLIADGQRLVRAGLRALLEVHRQVAVVGEAADGEEAVAEVAKLSPDVVLIDADLPGLGRVETTALIAAESRVRVLVVTRSEDDERILPLLRAGATGLLGKDAAPREVVQAVIALARAEAVLSPTLTARLIEELAAGPDPCPPHSDLLDELTAREREVVALVALGLTNAEIAARLGMSRATAKTHVSRAMVKLNAHDRAKLVVFGYEAGFVVPRSEHPVRRQLALAS
jgi:DNA-binding NarL/FixJ family response regulator